MISSEGGYFSKSLLGLMGRCVKLPPQFGQTSLSISVTQVAQNVHSKVQIMASSASKGKDLLQCSQVGLIASMKAFYNLVI